MSITLADLKPEIRYIVGRFHVSDSENKVACEVSRMIEKAQHGGLDIKPKTTIAAIRFAIDCHHKNIQVMRG